MRADDTQLPVFFDYDNQKVNLAAVLDYFKELGAACHPANLR